MQPVLLAGDSVQDVIDRLEDLKGRELTVAEQKMIQYGFQIGQVAKQEEWVLRELGRINNSSLSPAEAEQERLELAARLVEGVLSEADSALDTINEHAMTDAEGNIIGIKENGVQLVKDSISGTGRTT